LPPASLAIIMGFSFLMGRLDGKGE
jgi:hypothetical protein